MSPLRSQPLLSTTSWLLQPVRRHSKLGYVSPRSSEGEPATNPVNRPHPHNQSVYKIGETSPFRTRRSATSLTEQRVAEQFFGFPVEARIHRDSKLLHAALILTEARNWAGSKCSACTTPSRSTEALPEQGLGQKYTSGTPPSGANASPGDRAEKIPNILGQRSDFAGD